MELTYDLWHMGFTSLVQQRAPPAFEVQSEMRLSIEPQRADLLLLRRLGLARDDGKARVLRGLWPLLGNVTILEFKSPINSSFRKFEYQLEASGEVISGRITDTIADPMSLKGYLGTSCVAHLWIVTVERAGKERHTYYVTHVEPLPGEEEPKPH
jgi:hypothetical protein